MAFIRTKKIKGNKYVYLAENKWMKRGKRVKQISRKYLGRLFRLEKEQDIDFFSFHKIDDKGEYFDKYREEIIYDVIKWELYRHGFLKIRNIWKKDDIYVNLRLKQVLSERGKAALGMNEGFLTGYTMSRLIRYKAYIEEDAYELAKLFVEAGLDVPKPVFVAVFSKYDIREE